MCKITVRLLKDGPYGKRNRTATILSEEFNPEKHALFGRDTEVIFKGTGDDKLQKYEGKPISAIDPGNDKPLLFLEGLGLWLQKSFVVQQTPV